MLIGVFPENLWTASNSREVLSMSAQHRANFRLADSAFRASVSANALANE